ncbi:MAG: LLM class flavin-dependent oxidoreductase [Rhodospirillales bacterium]|nr:LLM class flavin-dependent oxidoreductase [Rhodospirillales bacterium]
MNERADVAFGFTVGPVMPTAQDGPAGDCERYRAMLEDCRFGQSLGFGSVWVLEHHFTDYYPSPSPLLLLSHVAAACPGLGLGTAVIVLPWYEPVRFAEELAMLSLMTDAELHIGLGRGVARIEYDARNIDMAHSRDLFREHYEIADGLLSGAPFRYEGTHATIPRAVTLRPGPVRERIHLYGACNNPGTAERMAEMGLGLLCTSASPFRQNADSIEAWKAVTAAKGGHADANLPLWIHCFVADSEAEARDEAITYLAAFFRAVVAHYETHANPWKDVPTYERNVQQMERMEAMADPANLPPFLEHQLVGTPAQVAAQVRRYREIGVTQFAINTAQPGRPAESRHRSMERFAREVIPLV